MDLLFQKTLVKITNKPSPKYKPKSLLHAIGGGWYMEKLGQKLLTLKKSKLSKKTPKEEHKIKRTINDDNQE